MGNHGVLTAAKTVAKAFDDLFYFERSCQTLIGAYQTGQKLTTSKSQRLQKNSPAMARL